MKMDVSIVDILGYVCAVLTNSNTQHVFLGFFFLLTSICTHHNLLELKIYNFEFVISFTASYDILH